MPGTVQLIMLAYGDPCVKFGGRSCCAPGHCAYDFWLRAGAQAGNMIESDKKPQVFSVAATTETAATDKQLIGGIAWTATARWSSQILSWASLLIVARLLSPADFGLVGMASVFLGFVNIFSEFGLGSALITIRDMSADDVARINTFSMLSGFVGCLGACAFAVPLGWFFRSDKLPSVVIAMSIAFAFAGFRTVPYSLLQKQFRFKLLSIIDTVAAISQSLCVLLVAWFTHSYWSLVAGNVCATVVSTGLTLAFGGQRFGSPRPQSISHALRFSWRVLVGRLAWTFYSDADFLVAGRMLGAGALGVYTFAWNLATLPVEKVTALVGQVTPAFFSANQSNQAALRRHLRILTEAISLITFPVSVALGIVAPAAVPMFLGKSWAGVVGPLTLLALYASVRSVAALLGPLLTSVHEARFVMWNNLAAVLVMTTAFYVGSHWGATGIAWGWILGYPFIALPLYWRTFYRIGMSLREYLSSIWPALSSALLMMAVALAIRSLLHGRSYVTLVAESSAAGLTYCLALWFWHSSRLRSLWTSYRGLRASA